MTLERSARELLEHIDAVYVPKHEYVDVSLRDVPGLRLKFYESFRAELERAGFVFVADIEDLTMTNAPGSVMRRTAIRTMLSSDGTIMAAAYDARLKLFWRLFLRLFGRSVHPAVDFETEYDDGSFLVTSNAESASLMSVPPMVFTETLKVKTPTLRVLDAHRLRMQAYEGVSNGTRPIKIQSEADLIRSQDRLSGLKAAYRAELGGISLEELQRMEPKWSSISEEFHRKCIDIRAGSA